MTPNQVDNQEPAAQPQPPQQNTQPVQTVQLSNLGKKKIKNAGRSLLVVGIFYAIILLLSVFTIGSVPESDQAAQMLSMGIGAIFVIAWIVLGILILKSKKSILKTSKIVLVALVTALIMLIFSLVRGNINIGTVIVLVLAIYLTVSYVGMRKLSE